MADEEAVERDMLSGDTLGQPLDRLVDDADREPEPEIWIDENGAEASAAHATTDDPSEPIQISDSSSTADPDLAKLADELARAVHARRRRRPKAEVTLHDTPSGECSAATTGGRIS